MLLGWCICQKRIRNSTATGTHKQKQLLFCLKCVYLPASTCTRTPHIYFSSSSVPYKEVACISPPFVPHKVSQECYQTFIAKVRSGILYMKHLKDFRETCVGRPDESQPIISPKDPNEKFGGVDFEFMWNLLPPKKSVCFYRNVQIWATRKVPICITKQSLTNQLQPLSNAYPC